MTIEIKQERVDDCIDEIKPLNAAHWEEIAGYKKTIPLDPNYDQYRKVEETGKLLILTARDDGKLVGYSIFFLINHIHYQSTLMAMNDILYLSPDYRQGGTGVRLIKGSEEALRELGAVKITWHCKPINGLSSLLARLGYNMDEVCMGKLL